MTPSDPLEVRRKRLKFRSSYRGMKELDLLISAFAQTYLDDFDSDALRQYEAILDVPDSDLLDWVVKKAPIPAVMDTDVMKKFMSFKYTKPQS